ncbi:MAG: phosphoglucosamine mutase [Haloferacaceae archaeon]
MFGTSGIRGPFGATVDTGLARRIGRALAACEYDRVVVGRDGRETGEILVDALAAGARECGTDVVRLGRVATPTLARSVARQDADAGVVVTASHNPPADNGFKFWTPSGTAFGEERRAALETALDERRGQTAPWDALGSASRVANATARHRAAICESVPDLSDLRVVVDVGNGMGGVTVDALRDLGATVETLNADVDGRFPARSSEPTAETCESLCAGVAATDAQLGVAHDGDADRAMAVDESGAFVGGDELLALFATTALANGDGGRVAVPVDTSLLVADAVAGAGGTVERTPVGDVFVAEAAREAEVVFGGEPSGAWIWPDETLCPDGPLAACRLAAVVAERGPLSALVDEFAGYPIRRESIDTDAKAAVMDAVTETVHERYDDVSTLDGVRVDGDDGWFLVRASGTQPLVRVTAEARDPDRADDLLAAATALVETARDG